MGTVVVDAGVLVGVFDARDRHHEPATMILSRALAEGHRLVAPASAYAQSLVHPTRAGTAAVRTVEALMDEAPVLVQPVDRAVARETARLRARHGGRLRLPDALVVATARVLGAEELLTTDAGWPALDVPVMVVGT
ncbi:hypothetical protein BH20ACT9_BH20ACT9_12400 [soil metagenome]